MPDGSDEATVSTGPGKDLDPAYSHDGAGIAFESTRTGSGDTSVMNADGTGVVRLTTDGTEDAQPTRSPGGHWIARHGGERRALRPGRARRDRWAGAGRT